MRYQLYYASGSAAEGVRVILEEIGVPYDLIEATKDRSIPRSAAQLAINPNGWIPVLTWQGGAMYECAAITIYLCDRHSEAKLAPAIDAAERARYLQTLIYFTSSIQNAFQLCYYPDRFADKQVDESSAQRRGIRRLRETWKVIDDQIAGNAWTLGDQFSAADIYLHMLSTWFEPTLDHPSLDEFPNAKRIVSAVSSRPSVQKVYG